MAESSSEQHRRWLMAGEWSRAEHLDEIETTLWRSERHPEQSSTIATLLILDRSPNWKRLVAAHEWAADLVPRVRQRIVEPALPTGPPAWSRDPHFRLSYHLRRQQLGTRNTMTDLFELVQTLLLSPFDRRRPLWEATLVEGLEGQRAAYLLKIHHAVAGGAEMARLLSALHSRTRRHTPNKPVPRATGRAGERDRDPWHITADGLGELLRDAPAVAATLAGTAARAVANPLRSAAAGQRYLASLRRVLSPGDVGTPSPLLRHRDGRLWLLRSLECPLSDLRRAARSAGGSVNDAYLAGLLGGIRRYHEHHGVRLDELPITVPVSLRRAEDPLGGNPYAGAVIPAPVGTTDPAERIAAIRGLLLQATNEPAMDTFSLMAPLVNRVPSTVGAVAVRVGPRTDLAASNVPGVTETVYLAGARIDRIIPFGPLPGVAIMAVMTSYQDTCSIGLTIDAAAVDDVDVLIGAFQEGFAEVTAG